MSLCPHCVLGSLKQIGHVGRHERFTLPVGWTQSLSPQGEHFIYVHPNEKKSFNSLFAVQIFCTKSLTEIDHIVEICINILALYLLSKKEFKQASVTALVACAMTSSKTVLYHVMEYSACSESHGIEGCNTNQCQY